MWFLRTVIMAMVLAAPIATRAAVVEMVNGDRISGKITGRDDKYLHVNSPILGDIVLPLSSVSMIAEDAAEKGASAIAAPPPVNREQTARQVPVQMAQANQNTQGAMPQPPPQRLSDRSKYHGKRFFVPVAIDFIRKISSMYNLKSSFKVGLNYFNGPTDSRSANVAFTIGRTWLMNELKLDFSQDYAESIASDGTKTVSLDKMKTAVRYRYNMNKRMYFQSDTQYGYLKTSNIDDDYLQSFGYGWRIVQTSLWTFNVTPSLSCQYQVISGEDQKPLLAPTLYEEAEYRWTDTVKLRNELTALFPVTGENNPTVHFVFSLKNKLIGNAFINFDYLFDYDGAVNNSTNAKQQTLRVAFGVDF